MNTNINVNEMNLFFSKSYHRTEFDIKVEKITKILKYDFYSANEAIICEKIKQIPYYATNYIVLDEYDFIKVEQLNEQIIKKLENVSSNDNKYLLFKYNNETCVGFDKFIFNLKTPKVLIFHVLSTFSYLLSSLIKLNDNNICFFNLSTENIVFKNDNREKPIIKNFQNSLHVSKLNEIYITKIIKNTTEYTHKPLEVHVLFYLIQNDLDTINHDLIEEICEFYVKNLSILDLFSQKYKEVFKKACSDSLKKYINIPKSTIISDILEQNDTWDNYSLSILYLHIIGNISRVFSLKGTFISKFVVELTKNIHPDYLKRERLEKTKENYDMLYNEFQDWSFINQLPVDKMKILFENLSK